MSTFKQYQRKQIAELRPYVPGEALSERVSISAADREKGSPKLGDMIARNPKNHGDMWLVEAQYFADNFAPITETKRGLTRVAFDRVASFFYCRQRGVVAK